MLIKEVLNPFYIFQIASIMLWMWDGYRSYACCIILISTGSVLISLFDALKNNSEIRQMALYSCPVDLMRFDGTAEQIDST